MKRILYPCRQPRTELVEILLPHNVSQDFEKRSTEDISVKNSWDDSLSINISYNKKKEQS